MCNVGDEETFDDKNGKTIDDGQSTNETFHDGFERNEIKEPHSPLGWKHHQPHTQHCQEQKRAGKGIIGPKGFAERFADGVNENGTEVLEVGKQELNGDLADDSVFCSRYHLGVIAGNIIPGRE